MSSTDLWPKHRSMAGRCALREKSRDVVLNSLMASAMVRVLEEESSERRLRRRGRAEEGT